MTTKRAREKPIVAIRALDYRWVELVNSIVPGAIETAVKAAWRLQFRREGETEWTPLSIITIQEKPPDDLPQPPQPPKTEN
jgi:hypothetical protein